jgi:3-methyl-2-oxobutanoate hydroxymethyltransferase
VTPPPARRITLESIARLAQTGEPIVMVTAYDFNSASAAEAGGSDIVLVGDSAAMTMLGYESTRLVSLEEMLMLTRAVRRGLTHALLVGDMPFGAYEASDELAVATAQRFVEAGCEAVKLESGGGDRVLRARAIISAGIPVMGHVGLTPQSTSIGDPYRVQGRTADDAMRLLREAQAFEAAGCFCIVFEAIPALVSELLMPHIHVPVIGIGAGAATSGQVLVFDDVVGLTAGKPAKFVKRYAHVRGDMSSAITAFAADVRARRFPAADHTYAIDPAELESLKARLER